MPAIYMIKASDETVQKCAKAIGDSVGRKATDLTWVDDYSITESELWLVTHGDNTSVETDWGNMNAEWLADYLKSKLKVDSRPNAIFFYACKIGGGDLASDLARHVGINVTAPKDTVTVYDSGESKVRKSIFDVSSGWITYTPQGGAYAAMPPVQAKQLEKSSDDFFKSFGV